MRPAKTWRNQPCGPAVQALVHNNTCNLYTQLRRKKKKINSLRATKLKIYPSASVRLKEWALKMFRQLWDITSCNSWQILISGGNSYGV